MEFQQFKILVKFTKYIGAFIYCEIYWKYIEGKDLQLLVNLLTLPTTG